MSEQDQRASISCNKRGGQNKRTSALAERARTVKYEWFAKGLMKQQEKLRATRGDLGIVETNQNRELWRKTTDLELTKK
jgi:hypothetical protein